MNSPKRIKNFFGFNIFLESGLLLLKKLNQLRKNGIPLIKVKSNILKFDYIGLFICYLLLRKIIVIQVFFLSSDSLPHQIIKRLFKNTNGL